MEILLGRRADMPTTTLRTERGRLREDEPDNPRGEWEVT
jgi:hypothetical protein